METEALERMWAREERVDWAEAALRDELASRDTDFAGLAARFAEPSPGPPAWLGALERPTPMRRPIRYAFHALCALSMVVVAVIFWTHRPIRPDRPAENAPSLMEGVEAPVVVVSADALRHQAVEQMRGSLGIWWRDTQAIREHERSEGRASPWDVARLATVSGRYEVDREVLGERVAISSLLAANDKLNMDLERAARSLPDDLREQFSRTVVMPMHAYTDAEKQRMAIERSQLALIDDLGKLAARQPPSVDPKTGKAAFADSAAATYMTIVSSQESLTREYSKAESAARAAYNAFLRDSALTLGQLGR
ncbi:MAG: hypothetical protein WBW32_14185 [Luteibacter sp.]